MTEETAPVAGDVPARPKPNMTIQLSRPLTVHGKNGIEQITELKLRDPTADDVFELDDPTRRFSATDLSSVETRINGQALKAWIVRLSGHDSGVIARMDAADARRCYEMITWRLVDSGN